MSVWLVLLSAVFIACLLHYWKSHRSRLPLPPGPRRLPFVGNVFDMPKQYSGADFRALTDKYGDMVYLEVFGKPMLILSTHDVALDLLEKRSALYSDRVQSIMIDLGGFDWVLTVMSYGPWWRRNRRAFHQFFNPRAVIELRSMQRTQVNHFLHRLLDEPDDFSEHIRHMFAATIMRVAYGIKISEKNDEYVKMAEEGIAEFSDLLEPGKYLVEQLPILRFLPKWMPGAQFRRDAANATILVRKVRDVAWSRTLEAMVRQFVCSECLACRGKPVMQREGTAVPSMTTAMMERISKLEGPDNDEEEKIARNTAATAYGGGADTTLSLIQAFFLVLASFPEVQEKARTELDAVVGPHRLPDFDDRDALPYVCAVIKECTRWHAIAPLGIPHRLIQDDEYRGYLIPKGTLVLPNLWCVTLPRRYPDPEAFIPERFLKDGKLNPDISDPSEFAFGYGRRICPGRHFAEASLFLTVSSVLHTLSVTPPLDVAGKPQRPKIKMTAGLVSYPEPFKCVIKPRAPWAEALIRANDQLAA
ncbi:cytochrome P450 [Trametes versicolor FP-101664 SS1]|uniref:cytochrome P450 n=1 Tax=Trametes versicolor (strain FP-101664) TaxID=717944 RepID=UPI0004622DF9|nr:cytochrome P450 [Trametes versicolor FP-101664 SS1]EIW55459.1 cytochrome P450 [Trametes versicolor FP-101664 SS1]